MRYIINVPNRDYSYDEILHTLKLKFYDDNLSCEVLLDAELYTESDRECIENEVWELANYMGRMSLTERDLCFGFPLPQEVTMNLSYNEAKSKFEAWLEQNEIHIGDEVVDKDGYKGIVTYIECELCDVLWDDGSVTEDNNKKQFFKTGRHFDEVEELLGKIKGENK